MHYPTFIFCIVKTYIIPDKMAASDSVDNSAINTTYPDLTNLVILLEISGFVNTCIAGNIIDDKIDSTDEQKISDIGQRVKQLFTYVNDVSKVVSTTIFLTSMTFKLDEVKKVADTLGFTNYISFEKDRRFANAVYEGQQYDLEMDEYDIHSAFLFAHMLKSNSKNVDRVVIYANTQDRGERAIQALKGDTWIIPDDKIGFHDFSYLRLYLDPRRVEGHLESPHTIVLDVIIDNIIKPLVTRTNSLPGKLLGAVSSLKSWLF